VGAGERREEIPDVAETAARAFREAGLERIAILLADNDPVAAPFQQAFARRGGETEGFDSYERALDWLSVEPAISA